MSAAPRQGAHPSEVCKADPRASRLTDEQKRTARCRERVVVRRAKGIRMPVKGNCNKPAHWDIGQVTYCTQHAAAHLQKEGK